MSEHTTSEIELQSNKNIAEEYQELKAIHQLQKNIAKQSMHNAMSPISAISGYLELINIKLCDKNTNIDQIESYRKKIEEGINEVNAILEQLQEVYQVDEENEINNVDVSVDLNWIIRELYDYLQPVVRKRVKLQKLLESIHIMTDLQLIKLIISNLINSAVKYSYNHTEILLETNEVEGRALLTVQFITSHDRKNVMSKVIEDKVFVDQELNCFKKGIELSTRLARKINGEISLTNIDGKKQEMTLSLPLAG